MIKLNNINKYYPSKNGAMHALKDINFEIKPGEIYGIIGRSGAGKSTLIHCINLLDRPDSGSVVLAEQDLTELNKQALRLARRQMSMIFQSYNLLSSRNVYDNIALPLEIAGIHKNEFDGIINPLLDLVGLTDKRHMMPNQLSGGQKQRVAIARALANKPKVLLCDEATSALDPETTKSILKLLQDINKKLGVTILLITHNMQVIKDICDRVAILDQGSIVEHNDVLNFFIDPQTDIAKNFVASSMKSDLPEAIQSQLQQQKTDSNKPVIRVTFKGSATTKPLINQLAKKFDIETNILQGNMELVHQETIGILVVELLDHADRHQSAIQFLQDQNLHVELLGYIDS